MTTEQGHAAGDDAKETVRKAAKRAPIDAADAIFEHYADMGDAGMDVLRDLVSYVDAKRRKIEAECSERFNDEAVEAREEQVDSMRQSLESRLG